MKKILLILGGATILSSSMTFGQTPTIKRCGVEQMHEYMISQDPSWAQRFADQKASLQAQADAYEAAKAMTGNEKTTTVSAIPVVFHIVLDSAQFLSMGGATGIAKRCDSQIAVLNRDFNKQNYDSTLIPTHWKSLYGNAGIHFGLALTSPTGVCTPGYEIKIITSSGFSNMNNAFPEAKTSATGLAAWDVTQYYNVWCINFTGSASSLLGITVPKSQTGLGGYPSNEEGVCILYSSLGCTGPNSGVAPGGSSIIYGTPAAGTGTYAGGGWFQPYNLGRTLTHETGHFLEIWHTWGDDGGLCPWSSGGGDDGLTDTPPESDAVYGNPAYTVTGGTYTDACKLNGTTNTQPNGIACLSYMDYTDDDAMHLFTPNQASTMAAQVLVSTGENYSLTQHPNLLTCPTAITTVMPTGSSLNIFPNPTSGMLNITVNSSVENVKSISVLNIMGQQIMTITGEPVDNYTIDMTSLSKGIYFVKCEFEGGSVTRKVVLQ